MIRAQKRTEIDIRLFTRMGKEQAFKKVPNSQSDSKTRDTEGEIVGREGRRQRWVNAGQRLRRWTGIQQTRDAEPMLI